MNILSLKNLSISFGGLKAIDNLSLEVPEKSIYGLIGPNGAGKTTVFNCISRFYKPDEGQMIFRPYVKGIAEEYNLADYAVHEVIGLGLARTFQNVELFRSMTVLENLIIGEHFRTKGGVLAQGFSLPKVRREEKRIREKAMEVLDFLGIPHIAYQYAISQPYGVQKLIELGRALLSEPKLLILDEPAAGMDQTETEELAQRIRQIKDKYEMSILLVEHDMGFVMNICERICAISFGKKLAEGSPTDIQNNSAVQEAYLGKGDEEDAS